MATFALSLHFLAAVPASAANPPGAVDDRLYFVEGQPLVVAESELKANDGAGAGGHLQVVDWPEHGELEVIYGADGARLTYRVRASREALSADFEDRFSYRWIGPEGPSNLAEVTAVPLSTRLYFAGKWERAFCLGGGECGDFASDHLGWFDGQKGEIKTCRVVCDCGSVCTPNPCLSYPAPPESEDWTPLVGDWDGDGWDDLGLFDPTTGWVRRYLLPGSGCELETGGCQLSEIPSYPALAPGIQPMAGIWDLGMPSALGTYDLSTLNVSLFPPGEFPIQFSLGEGGWDAQPVAEDWNGDGRETVGVFDFDTQKFLYVNDHASANARSFPVYVNGIQPRWAFSGHWNGQPFLGLRKQGEVVFYFSGSYPSGDEAHKGSIYLSIPEDPGGGCQVTPPKGESP